MPEVKGFPMKSEVIEFTAVVFLFCSTRVELLSLPGPTCCSISPADFLKDRVCVCVRVLVCTVCERE